jgi:transposase
MDNAPIHTAFEILELVESRGEKYLYLPTCSPFFYPTEKFWFWSKVKASLRRNAIDC